MRWLRLSIFVACCSVAACGDSASSFDGAACGDDGGSACGTPCASDAECGGSGGACCSGYCVDTRSDERHCGGCDPCPRAANSSSTCAAGVCGSACVAGFGDCDGVAANGCEAVLSSDTAHCGACATACAELQHSALACRLGACVSDGCFAGFSDCNGNPADGCEVNIAADPMNCGTCAAACAIANGREGCSDGRCVFVDCLDGFGDCDGDPGNGCETDLRSSLDDCGACGRPCVLAHAVAVCGGGQCGIAACMDGFADCNDDPADGCETTLGNDAKNCGRCRNVCPDKTPACVGGTCVAVKVLIVGAPAMPAWNTDVQSNLNATGVFAGVDVFNAASGTPSLQVLQQYQAILVYSDSPRFADSVALGDVVADYFDGGGQVVVAPFATAAADIRIKGRFGMPANGYMLIDPAAQAQPPDKLGKINEPMSPLVAGVKSLAATSGYRGTGAVINGGIVVAAWAGGAPLIVRGVVKGRLRVDLNFYPPSSAARMDFWSGDGAIIMRNALLYR